MINPMQIKYFRALGILLFIFLTLSCKSCLTTEEKKFKKLVVVMNGDIDARKLASFLGNREAICSKNGDAPSFGIVEMSEGVRIAIKLDGGQDPDKAMKSANELIKHFKLEKQLVEISIEN